MIEKLKQYFRSDSPKKAERLPDGTEHWRHVAIEFYEIAEKEKLGHRLALLEAEKLRVELEYYKNLLKVNGVKYD